MIISIDETRVAEAAAYAHRLNEMKAHRCKAFARGYDNILNSFHKMLKHPADEVLVCIRNDTIQGVLALCVEATERYLEAVGGVFAEDNYHDIALQFFEYIRGKYAGFRFDAAYPKENTDAVAFMQTIGANCIDKDVEMALHKNVYTAPRHDKQVILLSAPYYESFRRLHDERNPDVYWTSQRILSALNRFDVLIVAENEKMTGFIVTSAFATERREIYFLHVDEIYRKRGNAAALVVNSADRAFASGAHELTVMVGEDNFPAIKLYESLGFKITDTCLTYSIESL